MERRRVRVDGIELELAEAVPSADVERAGQIMLVHGFTGSGEDFADHLDSFAAEGWHVVAPTLHGHGRSEHPANPDAYSFERYADEVAGVAEALDWDRFALLGHSMGGMVAQVHALRGTQRLVSLVLMDTCPGPVPIDPGVLELAIKTVREQGMEALLEAQRALAAEAPLVSPAHERLLRERPGYAAFCDGQLLSSSPVMYVRMVQAMAGAADRLDALASLDVRCLAMVGAQDKALLGPTRQMAHAITGAQHVVIPDAGHSPQFENAPAWRSVMRNFLAGNESRPG